MFNGRQQPSGQRPAGLHRPFNPGPAPRGNPNPQQRFPRLTREERDHLRQTNGCFYCRRANAGHTCAECPLRRNRQQQQQPKKRKKRRWPQHQSTPTAPPWAVHL
jgi:hypothetical protein